ncbi:autophagy-related protein [Thraustotheca clavata]|uniref:Autophagy-related protein 9 n=1 Tax=Thraustotheca clavata TaxID=74557 RepID=A0A1V9ZWD2_9STRA|nr:autophagy-related protein [Thraustotheca clavata]
MSMNDALLDDMEKAEYDPEAVYQPLMEGEALKNRSRSVEDAEALWAELHGQPSPPPAAPFQFGAPLRKLSNIRPPTYENMPSVGQFTKPSAHVELRRHLNMPNLADIKNNGIFSSRKGVAPNGDGVVENVDAFLISLYNYYYHGGVACYVCKELVGLFNILFTVCLSTFLLGCIDWARLARCNEDEIAGCKQPLSAFVSFDMSTSLFKTIVLFYFLLFIGYWFTRVLAFISSTCDALDMNVFYTEKLRIDARQVQTMKWDEVLDRLFALMPTAKDRSSSYTLKIDSSNFQTPLDIARRVMRKENYLIAFLNSPLFHVALPLPAWLTLSSHVLFSRNMEWNINVCLFDFMLDNSNQLHPRFKDPKALEKRLVTIGILNLVLTPFLLLFRIIQFFLLSTQEWYLNKTTYLSTRRWSPLAMWTFREYNELPHVFDTRMSQAYPAAEAYLALFPAGIVSILATGVSFCAGSIMAVLVVLSVVEESILLEVQVYDRQLLWYLTLATGVFALARTFHTPPRFMTGENCEEAMTCLSAETHYERPEWKGHCHTYATRDEFLQLYPYKAVLFLEECISVLLTPYMLCIALPPMAQQIVDFCQEHTLTLPNVGAVCRYAEFDFKAYGGEPKMESSFMNFKRNHPSWMGPAEGEQLAADINRFKGEEMERSLRMGDSLPLADSSTSLRLGDSMFQSSSNMTLSHQLMQSQAIQMALNGPQSSEYYWLQKHIAVTLALTIVQVAAEAKCSFVYCISFPNPVCGSNGQTYRNSCYLDKAMCEDSTIEFAYRGECKLSYTTTACPKNYFPVWFPWK